MNCKCGKLAYAKGLCKSCYASKWSREHPDRVKPIQQRYLAKKTKQGRLCQCGKIAVFKDLCKSCYQRQWRNENPALRKASKQKLLAGKLARGEVCQCGKPVCAKGLCLPCYRRERYREKHPEARSAIEIQEQRTIRALFRHLTRLEKSLEFFQQQSGRHLCRLLSDHHEALKDDTERLTTGFLIGLICGEEKKAIYLEGRYTP